MRRHLLSLLDRFEAGAPVDGALNAYARDGHLPFAEVVPAGADWRLSGTRKPVSA